MTRNIHIHLHDASGVIKPTTSSTTPKATTPPKSSTPPGSSNKPIHQAPTKPPAHEPLIAKSTEVVKKTGEAINKTSEAIERNRQKVTDFTQLDHMSRDDMSRTTKGVRVWGESPKKALAKDEVRKSGGVTTWGGVDPKKIVPKPTGLKPKPVSDAGTSEGARKAAQTRAHGGGATPPVNTRSNRGFIHSQEKPIFNAAHHHEQAEKHTNTAKSLAKIGGKEHNAAAALHSKASRLHTQATVTGRPEHVAEAKAAANRANAASRKLGHTFVR